MVRQDRWEEIHRLAAERVAVAEIARRLDLDRKTVRRCLRQESWRAYRRAARPDTLLATHAEFLRERAAQVRYSARILFQELRQAHGYAGSYETVKLFVRPLRAEQALEALTQRRFETPPGAQSQIDWGQARVHFRTRPVELHVFVLTLGFSRRSFYQTCADERLSQFLDAHEHAFAHFGGHTHEHLYDRPRTVCTGSADGKVVWNATFKAFAEYWGFEPRVCRPYRAQTKGKVESGVKYFRRNFLPGRQFIDQEDFQEQLAEWTSTIADLRVHGTTHERPLDRFARERDLLVPVATRASFQLEAPRSRIVADDYLVSLDTNRYSVPFQLIGRVVEVVRRGEELQIRHGGEVVARHPVLSGSHEVRIDPGHGPGAVARTARQRRSTPAPADFTAAHPAPIVEVRDLAIYDAVATASAPTEAQP
ncbi:MAG: IS21 family transposase [Candidatus Binatia bacterium]